MYNILVAIGFVVFAVVLSPCHFKFPTTTTTRRLLSLSADDMTSTSTSSSSDDRLSRWQDRWDKKQLGWHEPDVHEALQNYGHLAIPNFTTNNSNNSNGDDSPVRVLVPLCGKTVDMAFLAKHASVSQVVGIDGIAEALLEFVKEHPSLNIVLDEATTHKDAKDPDFECYVGTKILLVRGDFFETTTERTRGSFEVVWDRASLVAIDPSLRMDYVETIGQLLKPGGKILLVVIERYDTVNEQTTTGETVTKQVPNRSQGPPFALFEDDVRTLYEGQPWVESVQVLSDHGEQNRNQGTNMGSKYYLITAKK